MYSRLKKTVFFVRPSKEVRIMDFISLLRGIVRFKRDHRSGGNGPFTGCKGKTGRRSGRRLCLEPLEERQLLSLTVNTLDDIVDADDGLTSLREALNSVYEENLEAVEITFDESALRSSDGANLFMIGWKWSDEIAAGEWYFDGTNVVQNISEMGLASGWTPGQGYGENAADEKSTLFNLTYDVSQWQYTEIIPAGSYYFDGTNIVQNTNAEEFAAGWMPEDWTEGALNDDEINAAVNKSNWTLTVDSLYGGSLTINGTLNEEQTVKIAGADPLAAGVMFSNYGTLTLADLQISAQIVLNQMEGGEPPVTLAGTVSLGYATGVGFNFVEQEYSIVEGVFLINAGATATFRDYYNTYADAPGDFADYLIHNIAAESLVVGVKDGKITTPEEPLTLTSVIDDPAIFPEETPGLAVAEIDYFGVALPTAEGQGTFAVTRGTDSEDVSSLFEFVAAEGEATGIKVKDAATLAAGDYAVTVSYGNLSDSIEFTVTASAAALTLDKTSGTATPRTIAAANLPVAAGTATGFSEVKYSLAWTAPETVLDVDDFFEVVETANEGEFNLVYKGGLAAQETAYSVRVTAWDDLENAADADFSLTVVQPSVTLSPDAGEITFVTESATLAQVETANFAEEITWSFKLEQGVDTTHFKVEKNADDELELIYTKDGNLTPGTYELAVTANDGIDSITANYLFTVLENRLDVVSIFTSITVNNHDLDTARLVPVNVPAGTISYSLSWDSSVDIGDYFTTTAGTDRTAYIHYSSGLPIGTYVITATATCTPSDPADGTAFDLVNTYKLTLTSSMVTAGVTLDPTNKQMEVKDAVDGLELASVALNGFESVPSIKISAWNTTVKNETSGITTPVDYSDYFVVSDGKLVVDLPSESQKLISGEYAVTITAETYSGQTVLQTASATFTLTLYDKKVETDTASIELDYDDVSDQFILINKDTGGVIEQAAGSVNVLLLDLDSPTTPRIILTQNVLNQLDAISVETVKEGVLEIEKASVADTPITILINGSGEAGYTGPNAVAVNVADSSTGNLLSRVNASNLKTLELAGNDDVATKFQLNALPADVLIDPGQSDTLSFEGSETGLVLNLNNTEQFQSAYVGQNGALKLADSVETVVLSAGNDLVFGSQNGGAILDNSNSKNAVILAGNEGTSNVVELGGGSTVIVSGEAINNITIGTVAGPGDNTFIDLTNSIGPTYANLKGNNVTVAGGKGSGSITIEGENAIYNSSMSSESLNVTIAGNNAIIKTGSGNDKITLTGNICVISTGAGDDVVFINGTSTGNTINLGDGDDILISDATAGGNTIYADNGNDFVVGGGGNDRIYTGNGFNLLAGGGGVDSITGGTERTGRDILIANLTSKMVDKTVDELLAIRNKLFMENPWWDNLEAALDTLGRTSAADNAADTLTRGSGDGIEVFFRNLLDSDLIKDALENDSIFG